MPDFTQLAGPQKWGEPGPSDILEGSIIAFYQWGLLGKGAFANVRIPTSGIYGGYHHQLRLTHDPRYTLGQVWQSARKDWVWESGVDHSVQPVTFSGVFVGGVFRPGSGVGSYSFKVDYPGGRIIFNSAIPTGSVVTAEYSYRRVQIYRADEEWFQQLHFNSFRPDDPQFIQYASGAWSIFAQNRVQLPALVVESKPNISQRPYEQGSNHRWQSQDVVFHVLAESPSQRKDLFDILIDQYEKRFYKINPALVIAHSSSPLNVDGSRTASNTMYPDLVNPAVSGNCSGGVVRHEKITSGEYLSSPRFYWSVVRTTFETDLP